MKKVSMDKKTHHKTSTTTKYNPAAALAAAGVRAAFAPQSPAAPSGHAGHHHSGLHKHRSSGSHHHNKHHTLHGDAHAASKRDNSNNNNITSNNNTALTIVDAKSNAAYSAVAAVAYDQLQTVVNTKAVAPVRNKNEEAINDLRQRIPEIENIFDVHMRIGNGTFSTVLLGTLKKERDLPEHQKRKFAIKHHIPTSHPDRIMKELQCMAKIGGTDNVVGINCCIRYNESVAFIMPYLQHDRFHEFFNRMDLGELQCYMKNLLIALRHVHKFNVIHRDVKPSNFLYNRNKRQFLLVDFGLAQQVPTPQIAQISALNTPAVLGTDNTVVVSGEGKRMREGDHTGKSNPAEASVVVPGDVLNAVNAAKRLRVGPQGDQQTLPTTPSNTRLINSCGIMNSGGATSFKMPLKQLNEVACGKQSSNGNNVGTGGSSNSICETPVGRQVKSAIIGAAMSTRQRGGATITPETSGSPTLQSPACSTNVMVPSNSIAAPGPTGVVDPITGKFNPNRNLIVTNNTKNNAANCYCYGNPQVCNICLVKKEIHASRAGTPGYRPPEVLLKYPDQTTAVDVWAAGVIFLSILSSVYPFFKAPNDYVALAEMVTIFGDKTIRKTAFLLDRLVTLSQRTKPLDLRKLCVRFRNRSKFSSPELLKKYQNDDGSCEVCKNCDQFFFNCLCADSTYDTEPLGGSDDPFPASAYDLLYKLLEVNPHQRITAEEALKHPFFSEISSYINSPPNSAHKKGH